MNYRGHHVQVENYGIDNSGAFVEESDSRPDFCVQIDGKPYYYEVKQNQYTHRNSFKTHDLKSYIEADARILLFYGIGSEGEIFFDSRWAIVHPESMQRMLNLPKVRTDKTWGNKEIVIVYKTDFSKYWKEFNFKHIIYRT